MNLTGLTYLLYLAMAVPITIWVGRTLFRNGKVFLLDVFKGREDLAKSVNALLVVGFYLLNLGFVTLYLRLGREVYDGRGVLENLSAKVGFVLIVLAVVHLTNVWVFSRWRRRSLADQWGRPPLPPQGWTATEPPRGPVPGGPAGQGQPASPYGPDLPPSPIKQPQ